MQYINRDISWLSFNHRVLQEAQDPEVPLLERIKFLAIYSSNLNEFYRVRVANLRNLSRTGKKTRKELDFDPEKVYTEVRTMIAQQQTEFSRIFEREIIPELRKNNIYLLRRLALNEAQQAFVVSYFKDKLLPFVQPVLLVQQKIRPFLNNSALYLAVSLTEKQDTALAKDKKTKHYTYGITKIPSDYVTRFVTLPPEDGRNYIIMLDDVVRHCLPLIYPGYDIHNSFSIKLTRDAELTIDDEFSGNLIDKIANSLAKRGIGPAARFAYDREMPERMLDYVSNCLGIEREDCVPVGRYLSNYDFFQFPDFGLTHLQDPAVTPLPHKLLDASEDIFEAIAANDQLLHFPYQPYSYVVRFFEEAAADPNVVSIRITQYRVAEKSAIMEALIRAARSGKEVLVFVEIKARFDEETNLRWAQKLQDAGAKVLFSHPGIKVHAKMAIVTRTENDVLRHYCYLSTGNFNEKTARTYVDFGFMTANTEIAADVQELFSHLNTRRHLNRPFQSLLVGQFNLHARLLQYIDTEIAHAEAGKEARIILKLNSIEDKAFIARLYKASQAGVKIDLIVRGLCCLKAGVAGLSENIAVISIVDRYLEHHRVYWFANDGNAAIYLSSADWMTRNLNYRIETAFPIHDPHLRQVITQLLYIQLHDDTKARLQTPDLQNQYKPKNPSASVRTQTTTYNYLKDL